MDNSVTLEFKNITKTFPGVRCCFAHKIQKNCTVNTKNRAFKAVLKPL